MASISTICSSRAGLVRLTNVCSVSSNALTSSPLSALVTNPGAPAQGAPHTSCSAKPSVDRTMCHLVLRVWSTRVLKSTQMAIPHSLITKTQNTTWKSKQNHHQSAKSPDRNMDEQQTEQKLGRVRSGYCSSGRTGIVFNDSIDGVKYRDDATKPKDYFRSWGRKKRDIYTSHVHDSPNIPGLHLTVGIISSYLGGTY